MITESHGRSHTGSTNDSYTRRPPLTSKSRDSGGPAFEKFGDYRSAMGIISACFIPVGQNFGSRVLFSDIVQVRSIMGGNVAVW